MLFVETQKIPLRLLVSCSIVHVHVQVHVFTCKMYIVCIHVYCTCMFFHVSACVCSGSGSSDDHSASTDSQDSMETSPTGQGILHNIVYMTKCRFAPSTEFDVPTLDVLLCFFFCMLLLCSSMRSLHVHVHVYTCNYSFAKLGLIAVCFWLFSRCTM